MVSERCRHEETEHVMVELDRGGSIPGTRCVRCGTTGAVDFGETEQVRQLSEKVGFGRIMQLCEWLWDEQHPGGAHSVGCCTAFLKPCPCKSRVSCAWCCGAGRVTERVLQAMKDAEADDEIFRHGYDAGFGATGENHNSETVSEKVIQKQPNWYEEDREAAVKKWRVDSEAP